MLFAFNLAAQFTSVTNLAPVAVSTNTGEKPQSKPWIYNGKWWVVLPNSSGTHLWRLDGTSWTHMLRISPKTNSKADCKVMGNITHVLLYTGSSSSIVSLEYVPASGTYQLWSKRTSTVGLTLDKGVETATIDIDGTGRMWLASAGVSDVKVRWSDAPYHSWSAPVIVATGISDDDICAVIALPGKIGVLWSNQNTKRFGFKTHADGTDPSLWTSDEVPASQSAADVGNGMADDHLNMAVASDGTLYCAVKTEYSNTQYPELALLVRRPSGSWDNLYPVATKGTRPIVILNETAGKLKVIYTASNSGGNILYRESSVQRISMGSENVLIRGTYNNTTSSKDNYTSDIVVLASNSTHAVGVLASDAATEITAPQAPLLASPQHASTGVALSPTLMWNAADGAASYQAQVSTSSGFSSLAFDQANLSSTSAYVSDLSANTTYYWRVRASNAAGTSSWSATWSFTTAPAPVETTTLAGHWKIDEGSGSSLADASGRGNNATLQSSPTWIAGVSGAAIRLNGSSQYATVSDHSSLDITGSVTLAAWIRPEKIGTMYVIRKGINNVTDGYELSLSGNGQVFFRFNQASADDAYRLNSTATYPTDGATWMHIAATYNGSVMKIYINGVENSSKTFNSPPPINTNNLILAIGAQSDGYRSLKGGIDDVRLYTTALSAAEISELSNRFSSTFAAKQKVSVIHPEDGLQVYPNPFAANATVRFTMPQDGEYSVVLYDIRSAKSLTLKAGNAVAGKINTVEIDGSNLAKGLYIVRLQAAGSVQSLKLMHER
ncbi:Por secretion system C-terminal sorting domain-containing protein [Pontibacter akesuensis]|uniref:Por secretion system C-terminal sorting domain-containing protein n=3 Tax=Pontibacter akesuensis TaxID=388950 RepID=A0A1I7J2F8_9BACT|nr:Por secretion system C-terminal sorting domain-containing protein [Pontibacter akesuensis]